MNDTETDEQDRRDQPVARAFPAESLCERKAPFANARRERDRVQGNAGEKQRARIIAMHEKQRTGDRDDGGHPPLNGDGRRKIAAARNPSDGAPPPMKCGDERERAEQDR